MDSSDTVSNVAFSEEEKLPEGIDEDANWFSKNLGDESDNAVENEVLNSQISQDGLTDELSSVKDSDLIENKESTKSTEEIMETDSQSELINELSDASGEKHGVSLDEKKDELTELKDIDINSKKHDINNELKEMFEEKSSDAEELHETSLKHSLDTDITKEDKLKDIVPDDILGKDDSFDELDNDALHQELEAHLSYAKNKQLISDLSGSNAELHDDSSVPHSQEGENENQEVMPAESEMTKSLDDLSFEGKSELLKNLTENIGTKEIDEIMQEGMHSEEDSSNKDISSELKQISQDLEESCVSKIKDDLENQLKDITGESSGELKEVQDSTLNTDMINQVDKESIDLNQENMMVEFAHGNDNQVLIQINTEKVETTITEEPKKEGIVVETSDGQTLVFSSSDPGGPSTSDADDIHLSQIEGGAEFLEAVTGKLEDVLAPIKEEPPKEETPPSSQLIPIVEQQEPPQPAPSPTPPPQTQPQPQPEPQPQLQPQPQPAAPVIEKKEPPKESSPKCCVSTCKSGKSTLRTTYRYFKPPVNKMLYKKWEYIFNQAKQELTPDSLICELHFRTGLIYKRGTDKFGKVVWALREGALPKLSPSGVLRVSSGVVPPPSTTVQVPKKTETVLKSPVTPLTNTVSPLIESKITSPTVALANPPKILGKKILQKPVKTVATKVSNEVTDIGFLYKNPELVKVAQEEIAVLDVLVCGECHSVFHLIELFQAHKMAANCKGESNFKGNPAEPKPQVWAFLLWKSAQAKVSDVDSSWKLYQRWCKMDETIRNSWIAAGKALQEGNLLSSMKMVESATRPHNKVGRPPTRNKEIDDDDYHARKIPRKTRSVGRPTSNASVSESEEIDFGGAGDSFPDPELMEVDNSNASSSKTTTDINEVEQTLDIIARRTPEVITSEVEIKQEVMSDDEHDANKENTGRKNFGSSKIQNCGRCQKEITNPVAGIICAAGCLGFFHVECTRVKTVKALSKMGNKKRFWKCDFCKEKDATQKIEKAKSDEIQNCSQCQKEITNPMSGVLCAAGCFGYYHVECTEIKNLETLRKMGNKKQFWKCDVCKEKDLLQQTEIDKAHHQVAPKKAEEPVKPPPKSNPEEEEFVVEKIVSRRYNIKKKHYEYLLKWEGYPSDQNTWEPAENLGTCQHLLKAFEEALAKQQAAKQQAAKQLGGATRQESPNKLKPPVIPKKKSELVSTPQVTSTGRPVRSSKQKAMDQVKQWCGSIVRPSEDDNVGLKRKADSDSEYDNDEEVVIKRVKVEVESDDSDIDSAKRGIAIPRGRGRPPLSSTARTPAQSTYINKPLVNGDKESNLAAALGLETDEEDDPRPTTPQKPVVRKMSSLSPHNQQVLVASAKGVMTVDPKQVNLTSGVYIMSNKSGIVKVDNNKTLNTLQKSGVLKKPLTPTKSEDNQSLSPQKPTSGVVVLSRSEAGTPQHKVGVIRKTVASTPTTQTTTTTTTPSSVGTGTPKPAGILKPPRPGISPRPLGLLKPSTPGSVTSPPTPIRPPTVNANARIQPTLRPRLSTPGRGRPAASPLLRRPDGLGLQATQQQKLLIARKKAESEVGDIATPPVSVSPVQKKLVPVGDEGKLPLIRPKIEPGTSPLPSIKSTNKILAHPLLSRGRGRGGFRGRGRGSSLSHLLQVREREPEPPITIKESKLVDNDNILMEFQEASDSEESDDGLEDIFPPLDELPPIEPDSPPRPLTLCPETGKVLCKAEGEKTPEPTPPPSPKPPTPPPVVTKKEPTHILPDHQDEEEPEALSQPTPVAITAPTTTTAVVKQDGMICKVEMSPGGTTGTLVEAVSAAEATPAGVTEGTVTIKKPLASRNRLNRGPQLSVVPNTSSTSLGTITVPARKLFQEENGDDNMVTITGEDGLVYQVSNSELAGNTLLVSSGEDGEQQCVYVTTGDEGNDASGTILTLDSAYANAVAQLGSDQVNILSTEDGDQYFIKEGESGEEAHLMTLEGEDGLVGADDQSGQVVAQLVEAGEPAPGGSRRVVLLLPDGNLMMTEVDEEQYAALDLDK